MSCLIHHRLSDTLKDFSELEQCAFRLGKDVHSKLRHSNLRDSNKMPLIKSGVRKHVMFTRISLQWGQHHRSISISSFAFEVPVQDSLFEKEALEHQGDDLTVTNMGNLQPMASRREKMSFSGFGWYIYQLPYVYKVFRIHNICMYIVLYTYISYVYIYISYISYISYIFILLISTIIYGCYHGTASLKFIKCATGSTPRIAILEVSRNGIPQ